MILERPVPEEDAKRRNSNSWSSSGAGEGGEAAKSVVELAICEKAGSMGAAFTAISPYKAASLACRRACAEVSGSGFVEGGDWEREWVGE